MRKSVKIFLVFLLFPTLINYGQDTTSINSYSEIQKRKEFYGFVRGGLYSGIDHDDNNNPFVSSAFSDFALKADIENGLNFKAFADVRFRYGVSFQEPVNRFDLREAYVKVNGRQWDIALGQKIVKWGRADFTNPTARLSPQNYISRSPDREDMDMGNLLSTFNLYPSSHINLGLVLIPFYRSSVLIIDPIPLPENVSFRQITSLITDKEMFTWGLKADFNLKGIDWSMSWFDGYDPMPGTALAGFYLDMTQQIPVPVTELAATPYKTRVLGVDFETTAGNVGIRGEAAWSVPYLSYETNEYVPLAEIKWVTGIDWSSGSWRFLAEYSGKYMPHFTPSEVDPVLGTEPDYSQFAQLMAIPGFELEDYVRQQVGAFNRLYNYQLERIYNSTGIRIEADLLYGKLAPSIFTLYNFTTRDLLIIPEVKFKPSDGLTITAGAELYYGRSGSLYDIVDDFMNNIYVAFKVDF